MRGLGDCVMFRVGSNDLRHSITFSNIVMCVKRIPIYTRRRTVTYEIERFD